MTAPGRLTGAQQRALQALLSSPSVEAAAAHAKVGVRSLYRWLKENRTFIAEYRHLRARAVSQTLGRLQHLSWAAVQVLFQVMADKDSPPSAKVAAASKILDVALRGCEIEDMKERIEALEQSHDPAPIETEARRVRDV